MEKDRTLQIQEAELYWEWLCSIPGLYRRHQEQLLRCFGSPAAVWEAPEKELAALEHGGAGWIGKVRAFQKAMRPQELEHTLRQSGIQFISRMRPEFPKRLLQIADPPYGLFFRGGLPEEGKIRVAVVGARMCSRYGKEMAQIIAGIVAESGGELVSGAAYGVDGIAQMEALQCGGKSFGILGCGADRIYPAGNRALYELLEKQGGILSEFPPGTMPLRHHFPLRNRLISGLSDAVVVVEARRKSGSLITADCAAEQGRDVYAVPGRVGDPLSEGCHELIAQGAGIFWSGEQFAESVFGAASGEKTVKYEQQALAPSEKLVYSSLDLHSKSLSELQECTQLPLDELSLALMSLENRGLSRETARNYFAKRCCRSQTEGS